MTALLELRDVSKTYQVAGPTVLSAPRQLRAVSDVSMRVMPGASVGLVGESGCGKSTLAKVAAGFIAPSQGDVLFDGAAQRDRRGRVVPGRRRTQMVFQDPLAALDARMTVGAQIDEAIAVSEGRRADIAGRRGELFERIGLNAEFAGRYPHELSGGQRQRVVIGRALAARPQLMVCDEPLAALDVSVQAQILALFQELRQSFNLSMLFISHQLSTVRYLCDEVIVMYAGRIVETGATAQVLESPRHPYTKMLLSTMLDPRSSRDRTQKVVGEPPNPLALPTGCPFHPRCPLMRADPCKTRVPELRSLSQGGMAACHFADTTVAA